jgi:hypothetical protein
MSECSLKFTLGMPVMLAVNGVRLNTWQKISEERIGPSEISIPLRDDIPGNLSVLRLELDFTPVNVFERAIIQGKNAVTPRHLAEHLEPLLIAPKEFV